VSKQHCLACKPYSVLDDTITLGNFGCDAKFAFAIVDEAAMTSENRLITTMMGDAIKDTLIGIFKFGNHKQLPVLVTSKDMNEMGDQQEYSHFHRPIKGGVKPLVLTENLRIHRNIADFPNHRSYDGVLTTHPMAKRKLHEGYAGTISKWLDDKTITSTVNLHMVNIPNSTSVTSPATGSRPNLEPATLIISLACFLRKHLGVSEFVLRENIVIVS
jgi:AAA domain